MFTHSAITNLTVMPRLCLMMQCEQQLTFRNNTYGKMNHTQYSNTQIVSHTQKSVIHAAQQKISNEIKQ